MKTRLALLLLTLGASAAAPFQNADVRFTAPANWTEKLDPGMGMMVAYLSPQIVNQFHPNLNLVVQPLPAGLTLEQYHQLSLKQLPLMITDGKVLGTRKTALGGQPAYAIQYSGKQGVYLLYWDAIYTVRKGKAYVLTGTVPQSARATFSPIFNRVFTTFQFVK